MQELLSRCQTKKVRVWGTLMLAPFQRWGLDVAEFDPDAVAQGDIPDVVFVTQAPGYFQHDVEVMYRAAAEGVTFVTLSATDQWSARIARRLGFTYEGVLTVGAAAKNDYALFAAEPSLVAGLADGQSLETAFTPLIARAWMHGMYLTGGRCLLGLADLKQGRAATAIAQYPIGRGGFTLVGPRLYENPDEPVCKRLLLNLIDRATRPSAPLNLPCVYHPTPPEGKPYFELNVPGAPFAYLTQARPKDHIWHLGFFFSWKFINGANFWEPDAARAGCTRVVAHRETGDGMGNATLESTLAYELDGRVILTENRTVKVAKAANGSYSFDWTANFEAAEDLAFSASEPVWDKEKGTCNGGGYAGLSARLARNGDFEFTYTNESGSRDQRCYGDRGTTLDVAAKAKRTGETTHVRFRADKPTANYALHLPENYAPDGFHFVGLPECFGETVTLAKGAKRRLHYTVTVEK